jgi:hypothetical protein
MIAYYFFFLELLVSPFLRRVLFVVAAAMRFAVFVLFAAALFRLLNLLVLPFALCALYPFGRHQDSSFGT